MQVEAQITSLGGIATRKNLVARGATSRALTAAVKSGHVRRIRNGWYTTLPASDPQVIAVRLGGVLTGAAALHLQNAWLWNPPRSLDVRLAAGASRPTLVPRNVTLSYGRLPRNSRTVATDHEALVIAVKNLPFEEAVAVLDWACHTGRLDEVDLHRLCARLPTSLRRIAEWVDRACESVLESIVRTRLRLLGYEVVSQVPVDTVRSIDLVVDGVLGLELDGRAYHESSFESDREKDLAIVLEGRSAMRVSYGMVRRDWPRVEQGIAAAVAMHRGHRRASGMPRLHERLQRP